MAQVYPRLPTVLRRDRIPGMSPNDPNQQDPSLDQGVKSSAQVPGSPNHDSPFARVIPAWVQVTSDMIIKSKPLPVQELYLITGAQGPSAVEVPGTGNQGTAGKRFIGAMALATQGFIVDYYDDALGNDPVVTMLLRSVMNIAQVDSIGNVGTIRTSLDPKDYPPKYPPPPPPPPEGATSQKLIGNFQYDDGAQRFFGGNGMNALHAYAAGTIKNGGTWSEGGLNYTVHISNSLMGTAISFSLPD